MDGKRRALLALAAVALTLGALWYSHREVVPHEATWEDVQAQGRNGGYRLINTQELAARCRQDPQNLLVVDTRQEWEYRSGHIQGARNFPLEPTWWSCWRATGRLAAFLGPDKDRFIVFY